MEVRFLDVAQQELDEAVEYYNSELSGLGEQLIFTFLRPLPKTTLYSQTIFPNHY